MRSNPQTKISADSQCAFLPFPVCVFFALGCLHKLAPGVDRQEVYTGDREPPRSTPITLVIINLLPHFGNLKNMTKHHNCQMHASLGPLKAWLGITIIIIACWVWRSETWLSITTTKICLLCHLPAISCYTTCFCYARKSEATQSITITHYMPCWKIWRHS